MAGKSKSVNEGVGCVWIRIEFKSKSYLESVAYQTRQKALGIFHKMMSLHCWF